MGNIVSRTPGLTRQYGTFPSASSKSKSSISIRGMGATGTLLLVDGERIDGEVKNPYDLDRIPASMIERIEIVKGPMSTLYGADAVGGVVNIITKQPTKGFQGSFGVKTGTNSHGKGKNHDIDLNIRGSKNKLKYSFYVGNSISRPYTQSEIAHVFVPSPTGKKPPSQHPDARFHTAKDTYKTNATYREKANVFNAGTKLEYELSDTLSAGVTFSYMDEERWGVYNGFAHPSCFVR